MFLREPQLMMERQRISILILKTLIPRFRAISNHPRRERQRKQHTIENATVPELQPMMELQGIAIQKMQKLIRQFE
jgi:hypothetical protein